MVGSMVACRQAWCSRGSWEFYILIHRKAGREGCGGEREGQTETDRHCAWHGLSIPQGPLPVTCFLQKGPILPNNPATWTIHTNRWASEGHSHSNHHTLGFLRVLRYFFCPWVIFLQTPEWWTVWKEILSLFQYVWCVSWDSVFSLYLTIKR